MMKVKFLTEIQTHVQELSYGHPLRSLAGSGGFVNGRPYISKVIMLLED